MSEANVGAAYDAIAADYDRAVSGDLWMRQRLWENYVRVFQPGQHVLDLMCGTGIDASFLADHGVRVTGIDVSPSMVEQFRSKANLAGQEERMTALVLDADDLSRLPDAAFDGAISAFAGLNTVLDFNTVAVQLARVVRPGGFVVLHLLNRFSLWEWLGNLAGGRWGEARKTGTAERRAFVIGGQTVRHTLYAPMENYQTFFAEDFLLRRSYGLGVLRPPHTVSRVPRPIVSCLERLESVVGGHNPFRQWGRFFVLVLQRRG